MGTGKRRGQRPAAGAAAAQPSSGRRQELTARQQQVLTLFFDQQMNMTEIAAELGVHRSTVSRTLHRAMDRLYRVLRYAL